MSLPSVYSKSRKYHPLEERVFVAAKKTLTLLKKRRGAEFYLLSDADMRALNRRFRGKDKATNVLSFERPKKFKEPNGEKTLGEIYIAPDFLEKNGQSLEHMVVHGLLHLCGYDHEKKSDALRMERIERMLLEKVGG